MLYYDQCRSAITYLPPSVVFVDGLCCEGGGQWWWHVCHTYPLCLDTGQDIVQLECNIANDLQGPYGCLTTLNVLGFKGQMR